MRASAAGLAWSGMLVALLCAAPLAAQGTLDRVESLASAGRATEARSLLGGWWKDERADAPPREQQRGLWLRGRLTLDGKQAELDFRRLVVEFPGGPYSDDALVRLAHGAHAEGDLKEAARDFQALLRDYPESPLRSEAQDWLDRFGGEAVQPDSGTVEEPAPDTSTSASPPVPVAPAPKVELPYSVQLGAFSNERRARRLWERARSAELEPRLVRIPGSSLIRVRVGTFPDSPSAETVLHRVRNLGFEATIVTDALKEEPLR